MEICEFLTLLQISVCVIIGLFFGSLIMFIWDYKRKKAAVDEIYELQQALDYYVSKYEQNNG